MASSPLTAEELLAGARLASENARAHCTAASHLARECFNGFAVAHLVYAVEEAGKAHVLTDRAMKVRFFGARAPAAASVSRMLRVAPKGTALTAHHLKQRIAAVNSWS